MAPPKVTPEQLQQQKSNLKRVPLGELPAEVSEVMMTMRPDTAAMAAAVQVTDADTKLGDPDSVTRAANTQMGASDPFDADGNGIPGDQRPSATPTLNPHNR